MAEKTAIAWTDSTFNPFIGCTKVSPGCINCYAERENNRFKRAVWGPKGTRVRTSAANWQKPLAWNRKVEATGEPHYVFCASLADIFELFRGNSPEIEATFNSWRIDFFKLTKKTPRLTWLLLTKRPENVLQMIPHEWMIIWPENVWIGTTAENQEMADKRIPYLLEIPAPCRFISVEPMLGPVSFKTFMRGERKWN